MQNNLVLHAGGWNASEEEVNAVVCPERTPTYTPIPHGRLIEQIKSFIPQHGMKLERLSLGLAKDGQRLFGVADVTNGTGRPDWGIAIGFRNFHDKMGSLKMCAGSRVFVCDNLAYHGEVQINRRHVGRLDQRLPVLVSDLMYGVSSFKEQMTRQIDAYKATAVTDPSAHDVVCQAVRAGAIPSEHVARVLNEWYEPSHEEFAPRTAWSLFNAFTEAAKARTPNLQIRSTLSLTSLFNREFAQN